MLQVECPKGQCLAHFLLILHVNDITDKLKSTQEVFADDSKFYRIIETFKDVEILLEDLSN